MEIVKVNLVNPERDVIERAAAVLSSSGLVVYPTDTAYGLGGNALNVNVVAKVRAVKGRSKSKPIHVVVRDLEMIEDLVEISEIGRRLINRFLPGPLTLIFKKKNKVPSILVGGGEALGVRIPDCFLTKNLSKILDFPYTTPSANFDRGKTPYSVAEVLNQFPPPSLEKIDLILDAGPLPLVPPSTIVDLTSNYLKILREGPIDKDELERALAQANV